MKKSRAMLFALGVPALYMALQFAATYSVMTYYYVKALVENPSSLTTDAQAAVDVALGVADKTISLTAPIMLVVSAVFLIILMFCYRSKPYSVWSAVGMNRNVSGSALLTSAVAGFAFNMMCSGLISVIQVPESWNAAHDSVTDALFGGGIFISVIFTVFAAPIVEEIVFRGFTHRFLGKIYPVVNAAILSGIVFGITHFNWLQTFYAFVMGIVLGLIYSWIKNLWATVAFHMAFNGANFILAPVTYLLFGDAETLPDLAIAVMVSFGAVISLYCVTRLYRTSRPSDSPAGI